MKPWITIAVFVAGTCLAIYLGFCWMLVGGVCQFINSIKSTPVDAVGICFGMIRFFLAAFVGWTTFIVTVAIAEAIDKS